MKQLLIFGLANFALMATNGLSPVLAQSDSYGRDAYQKDRDAPPEGCVRYDRMIGVCRQAEEGYSLERGMPRRNPPARPTQPDQPTQPTPPDQPTNPSVEPTDSTNAPQ